eukprot:Selendium_serpulae@DN3950_c0_g1_i1.p1
MMGPVPHRPPGMAPPPGHGTAPDVPAEADLIVAPQVSDRFHTSQLERFRDDCGSFVSPESSIPPWLIKEEPQQLMNSGPQRPDYSYGHEINGNKMLEPTGSDPSTDQLWGAGLVRSVEPGLAACDPNSLRLHAAEAGNVPPNALMPVLVQEQFKCQEEESLHQFLASSANQALQSQLPNFVPCQPSGSKQLPNWLKDACREAQTGAAGDRKRDWSDEEASETEDVAATGEVSEDEILSKDGESGDEESRPVAAKEKRVAFKEPECSNRGSDHKSSNEQDQASTSDGLVEARATDQSTGDENDGAESKTAALKRTMPVALVHDGVPSFTDRDVKGVVTKILLHVTNSVFLEAAKRCREKRRPRTTRDEAEKDSSREEEDGGAQGDRESTGGDVAAARLRTVPKSDHESREIESAASAGSSTTPTQRKQSWRNRGAKPSVDATDDANRGQDKHSDNPKAKERTESKEDHPPRGSSSAVKRKDRSYSASHRDDTSKSRSKKERHRERHRE